MKAFSPQWIAFCREAAIASQSLSAGLTSLRKANYAATGLYSHAFFSLSIGLERLLKLIFLVDFALQNAGTFPSEAVLRNQFRHDLKKLFDYALTVHARLPRSNRFPLPADGLEVRIVELLSTFAKTTRYYNLDYLVGSQSVQQGRDPIAEWYSSVGREILQRHYSEAQKARDTASAAALQRSIGPYAMIRHTGEEGAPLHSVEAASIRTGENMVLQKYGTFYCAKIARFLYMVLWDIENEAHKNHLGIPYLHEFFFPFLNDDSYLLSRKTFPPRGQ